MNKIAFLFPGQGSQQAGMGKSLYDKYPSAKNTFVRADEILGFSLSSLIFEGPDEQLSLTENTQPALLTTSVALLKELNQAGVKADYAAGHSLGEYSALVAAEALSFEDAVQIVRMRGQLMEEAVPAGKGGMAAVMGLDADLLEEVTRKISDQGEPVQLANMNSPGQIVISGTAAGVNEAAAEAKVAGARRVIPLNVSGPFHSSLMKPAAEKFFELLNGITINDPVFPVIANVDAKPVTSRTEIRSKLTEQLYSPVRWEQTVLKLRELGVDTFIEIGPGKVLSGLVKKIDRSATVYSVSDDESLHKTVNELKGESEDA